MDFRNTYVATTLRILLGLFMVFSGVAGFLAGPEAKGIPEQQVQMTRVFWDTGIFQLAKTVEIITGLMLLFNVLPVLAAIMLVPLTVGIIVINARISPAFLPMGIILTLFVSYFGYLYWDRYAPLFRKGSMKKMRS